MRRGRSDEPISLRFVADWEQRVAKQKDLVDELKRNGRSTAQAQAALNQQLETLAKLRNHADIMQTLMSPDLRTKTPGKGKAAEGST